jgi:hypothetical protein
MESVSIYVTLTASNAVETWLDVLSVINKFGGLLVSICDGYPRQNGLAMALRELGRIERTLFILDWLQNVELRRRVNAGLNKGEARNALARAVFFKGEIRDRSFEQQRYRASGLNLVTAAIVLWPAPDIANGLNVREAAVRLKIGKTALYAALQAAGATES